MNSEIYRNEDNDCSVKAVARIADISYAKAHSYCMQSGRVDKTAMKIKDFFKAIKCTGEVDVIGFNMGKTYSDITEDSKKKMTVKQASKAFADRHGQNFILMLNNHVIAVCDGEMEEHEVKAHARKRVKVVCEVMSNKEADNIKADFDRWGESYHVTDRNMGHHVYWEAI